MRFKTLARNPLLAIGAVLLTAACALGVRHSLVVVDTALYASLNTASQTADQLLEEKLITPAQRQQIAVELVPAIKAGREFNAEILKWDPSEALPPQVREIAKRIRNISTSIVGNLPAPAQSRLTAVLTKIQVEILNIIVGTAGVTTSPAPGGMTTMPTQPAVSGS